MSDSVQVPDGWVYGAIGDCVSRIGDGGTPATSNEEYYGGNIAWVVVHDITRSIKKTNSYITELGLKKSSAKLWQKNSVIISTGATIGEVGIAQIPLATKQGIAGIECNNKCLPEFLYYSLIFKKLHILSLAQGSTIKEVRTPILVKIPLLIPPLPEQKKIASILTSIDNVIEKTEAQISKLQDLKKGMMTELLTTGIGHTEFKDSPVGRIPKSWGVMRLGDLFTFKNGVNASGDKFGLGIKFINLKEVLENDSLTYKDIPGSVTLDEKEIENNLVEYGDVLFNRTSETQNELGLTAVYLDNKAVVFGGFVIRARPLGDTFIPTFLRYAFNSKFIRNEITTRGQGAIRANIGQTELKQIHISCPSHSEQKKISCMLSSIDSNMLKKQQKLSHTKSLKKALMNDLLTGKKRVTVN